MLKTLRILLIRFRWRKGIPYKQTPPEPKNHLINKDMKVIKKVEDLKPGKIIMPQEKAKIVIEGSTGTFKNIEEGKLIEIR